MNHRYTFFEGKKKSKIKLKRPPAHRWWFIMTNNTRFPLKFKISVNDAKVKPTASFNRTHHLSDEVFIRLHLYYVSLSR